MVESNYLDKAKGVTVGERTRSETDGGLRPAVPPTWLVVAVVLAGLIVRLWILSSPLGTADADEAVIGLMARHFLQGEIRAFYWGQYYGGTLEQFLVSGVFAVFGSSVLALKLVSVPLVGVACLLTWRAGRHIVGEGSARTAALILWVTPAAYLILSTKARAFYWLGLCLGLGVVLLCLRLIKQPSWKDAGVLGLLLGLAWWETPLIGFLVVPMVVYTVARKPHLLRLSWLVLPAFLVGAAPWVWSNLAHEFISLKQYPGEGTTYLPRLAGFFARGLPTVLGLRVPNTGVWLGGPAGKVVYIAAVAGFIYLIARRRIPAPLPFLALAYPFVFGVPTTSFFVGEPRYLLFLAPVLALVVAHLLTTAIRQVVGMAVALTLSLVGLVSLLASTDRNPERLDLTPGSLERVLEVLHQDDVSAAWAGYWIAYRVTFESKERIVVGSVDTVRYPPYQRYVKEQPTPAMIVYRGSPQDDLLGLALVERGVRFRRRPAERFAVYLPDRNIDPTELTKVWQAPYM